jgi:hypothetical protein
VTGGPVFIGGLSHSGKTPLRRLLGAHPQLSMTRRSGLWTRHWGRYGPLDRPGNLDRCLQAIAADPGAAALAPDSGRLRRELAQGPLTYPRLFELIHHHHAQRQGKPRWGDQLALSELVAHRLLSAFPTARFVHLVRDPRCRLAAMGAGPPGGTGWQTARWIDTVEVGRLNAALHPDRYRMVRYEDLAKDPATVLRSVCQLCAIEPTAEMLAAADGLRLDGGGAPDPWQARFVERVAGDRLPALGYPQSAGTATAGRRPVDRCAMAAWRLVGRRSVLAREGG